MMTTMDRIEPQMSGGAGGSDRIPPSAVDIAAPARERDFAARRHAAKISQFLKSSLIDTEHAEKNLLGEDFVTDLTTPNQRCFVLGHWTFRFELILVDDRGRSPQVYLSLITQHRELNHGEPEIIAHLSEFNAMGWTSQILDPETGELRIRNMSTDPDIGDFTRPAVAYIQDLLSSPAPVRVRAFNLFGWLGRSNRVQGRQIAADRA